MATLSRAECLRLVIHWNVSQLVSTIISPGHMISPALWLNSLENIREWSGLRQCPKQQFSWIHPHVCRPGSEKMKPASFPPKSAVKGMESVPSVCMCVRLWTLLGFLTFFLHFKNVKIMFPSYWDTLASFFLNQACSIMEPPLGVIGEQGEWPLRPKGARSMTWK